jgi:hypothetical protein
VSVTAPRRDMSKPHDPRLAVGCPTGVGELQSTGRPNKPMNLWGLNICEVGLWKINPASGMVARHPMLCISARQ